MTIEQSNLDFPITLKKIINYNIGSEELVQSNKEQIQLLINDIGEEIQEIKYPEIKLIKCLLKKKSKKFIIGKDYNIGNITSFGANIDGVEGSYRLIMMPSKKDNKAFIKFRYYPRSKTFVNLFNKLLMTLRTEKIKYDYIIDKGEKPNYIKFCITDEIYNEKFWRLLKLWAKN